MLSAKMNDGKILKGVIDAVSAIIDETYFVADTNGVTLTAMDESHILLMSMTLPKEMFTGGFTCVNPVKVGINLEDMSKIMKRAGATDGIELKYEKDSEKFGIVMKGRGTRSFNTRLVEVDAEKIPPTAELDVMFNAKVTFDVNILDQAIKDAEIYGDTLDITITKEGIKMTAVSQVGDVEYMLDNDHLDAADITTESVDKKTKKTIGIPNAHGIFTLNFLKHILKMSAICDKVTLSLAENAPVKVEFDIIVPEIATKGRVFYFLAPRVEEKETYEGD